MLMSTLRRIRARLHEAGGIIPDTQIATEFGVSHNRIGELRREMHLPAYPGNRSRIAWSLVDWTRSNVALAAELGCSARTVSNHRPKVSRPRAPARRRRTPTASTSRPKRLRRKRSPRAPAALPSSPRT